MPPVYNQGKQTGEDREIVKEITPISQHRAHRWDDPVWRENDFMPMHFYWRQEPLPAVWTCCVLWHVSDRAYGLTIQSGFTVICEEEAVALGKTAEYLPLRTYESYLVTAALIQDWMAGIIDTGTLIKLVKQYTENDRKSRYNNIELE